MRGPGRSTPPFSLFASPIRFPLSTFLISAMQMVQNASRRRDLSSEQGIPCPIERPGKVDPIICHFLRLRDARNPKADAACHAAAAACHTADAACHAADAACHAADAACHAADAACHAADAACHAADAACHATDASCHAADAACHAADAACRAADAACYAADAACHAADAAHRFRRHHLAPRRGSKVQYGAQRPPRRGTLSPVTL